MAKNDPAVRRRLVGGAALMIAQRGVSRTSIREVAKFSGTPLGSTYHYFPNGKNQLIIEAVQMSGRFIANQLEKAFALGLEAGIRAFAQYWRDDAIKSGFHNGCPVLAVSVDEPADEDGYAALDAAAETFASWRTLLANQLEKHGAPSAKAQSLATMIVASIEGTVPMCRAQRSTEPLDHVEEQLLALIRMSIPA